MKYTVMILSVTENGAAKSFDSLEEVTKYADAIEEFFGNKVQARVIAMLNTSRDLSLDTLAD
jgi:hypothetical protein